MNDLNPLFVKMYSIWHLKIFLKNKLNSQRKYLWFGRVQCARNIANAEHKVGGPRDLVGADALVQKVLDLVNYFNVPFFMENPQTGLLKSRDVVKGIPVRVIDYCSYADEAFPGKYRKRTGIWTNTDWIPARNLCKPSLCKFCSDGKKHDHACQQRSKPGQMRSSTKQLYRIPSALPEELVCYLEQSKL